MTRRLDCVAGRRRILSSSHARYTPSTMVVRAARKRRRHVGDHRGLVEPAARRHLVEDLDAPSVSPQREAIVGWIEAVDELRGGALNWSSSCDPIELDTSSMSDRSTMRRVASPVLVTVRSVKFARRMNVVGTVADAVTVTVLTPVTVFVAMPKKPGGGCRVGDRGGAEIANRKIRLEHAFGFVPRVAAVQAARCGERRAVHGLGQLRLHDVGAARVHGEPGKQQQGRQRGGHVYEDEALLARKVAYLSLHGKLPLRRNHEFRA